MHAHPLAAHEGAAVAVRVVEHGHVRLGVDAVQPLVGDAPRELPVRPPLPPPSRGARSCSLLAPPRVRAGSCLRSWWWRSRRTRRSTPPSPVPSTQRPALPPASRAGPAPRRRSERAARRTARASCRGPAERPGLESGFGLGIGVSLGLGLGLAHLQHGHEAREVGQARDSDADGVHHGHGMLLELG
eukprot:scaffold43254_cov60-Phaeocystis_antarctica.AAC.3